MTAEEERDLAKYIGSLCNLGFSPSGSQIKDLVRDYINHHKIKSPFKNERHGKNWLKKFMKRNRMSMKKSNMKKSNMICATKKSVTSNLFIVYDFYENYRKTDGGETIHSRSSLELR